MAAFNINTDFSDADDIQKVKSYLYRLNDQLQYMFANMTVEDNFSSTATEEYNELLKSSDKSQSEISLLESQIALKVSHSELGNSSLTIKPAAISIESGGTIDIKAGSSFTVDSINFKIYANGNVYMTGSFEQLNAVNSLVEINSQDTGGLLGWTAGSIRLKDVGVSPGAVAETNIILNGSGHIVANDYYIYDEDGPYEIEGKKYSSLRDLLHI